MGAALPEVELDGPSALSPDPVADGAEAPPVIVVVSWLDAVGRSADTVTAPPIDAEAESNDVLEKPHVLMIEPRSSFYNTTSVCLCVVLGYSIVANIPSSPSFASSVSALSLIQLAQSAVIFATSKLSFVQMH